MTADLIQLVYASKADTNDLNAALSSIKASAVAHNEASGITGVLLYRSGRFIQLLEGPADQTESLCERILNDPRHRDVTVLVRRPCTSRSAPSWSMGVLNLEGLSGDFEAIFDSVLEMGHESQEAMSADRASELIALMTRTFANASVAA